MDNVCPDEWEFRMYCASNYAIKHKDYVTPSTLEKTIKITWYSWFHRRYGEDLNKYRQRVKGEKR